MAIFLVCALVMFASAFLYSACCFWPACCRPRPIYTRLTRRSEWCESLSTLIANIARIYRHVVAGTTAKDSRRIAYASLLFLHCTSSAFEPVLPFAPRAVGDGTYGYRQFCEQSRWSPSLDVGCRARLCRRTVVRPNAMPANEKSRKISPVDTIGHCQYATLNCIESTWLTGTLVRSL